MGVFTSVIHPKDGRELQIKTDNDSCDTYHVGDSVQFYINKNIYGSGGIFDGVYNSNSDKGTDDWVVIKKHKIVAVESKRYNYGSLIKKYSIKIPSKKLWTAKVHKKYKERQEKITQENEKFLESIKNLPTVQRMGAILMRPLMQRRNYDSLARNILQVESL